MLLEGFKYLVHYGLVRAPGTRYERRHSWSNLSPAMRAAGLEIASHAHHHVSPQLPYYALVPDPRDPHLPSLLLCFLAFTVNGLQLAGASTWIQPIVNGAALPLAVSLSSWGLRLRSARLRRYGLG